MPARNKVFKRDPQIYKVYGAIGSVYGLTSIYARN